MRKVFLLALTLGLIALTWSGCLQIAAAAPAASAPPAIGAQAAALIDVTSGRILYSRNGDQELPIASLTKIMTAIVAIEHGSLSDSVTVSKKAFGVEGSSIYLKLGQQMSLDNMLYGLMLRSGNDAATAIAEHVGGSLDGFVYLMNEKARDLGLAHTHFANPHGLDAPGHYSSANDMARIAAYALHNPEFREIVKTPVKKVSNPDEDWDTVWANKNKMLSLYRGADGVKTGYTKVARRCLVSSATRNGQQLAVVTLNDPNDWADHARLLDYGFQHYPLLTLAKQGEQLDGGYTVLQTVQYALNETERGSVTRQLVLEPASSVDRRLGQAGTLKLLLDGRQVASAPVAAANREQSSSRDSLASDVDSTTGSFPARFAYWFGRLVSTLFTGAA